MPADKEVMATICRNQLGHNLASVQVSVAVNPKTNQLVPEFQILCTRCGCGINDLNQEFRTRRGPNKRKPKPEPEASLSSPPPPIDNQSALEREF